MYECVDKCRPGDLFQMVAFQPEIRMLRHPDTRDQPCDRMIGHQPFLVADSPRFRTKFYDGWTRSYILICINDHINIGATFAKGI